MLMWVVPMFTAGASFGFDAWWDIRRAHLTKDPLDLEKSQVTLKHLLVGALCTFCPVVNIIVTIGYGMYFIGDVAPKIVLFGGK
jgi:hypothetical protein